MKTYWKGVLGVPGTYNIKDASILYVVQDGVVCTRAHLKRIEKKPIPEECKVWNDNQETSGHILSSCQPYRFTLYKDRHNGIVYRLVMILCRLLRIDIPKRLQHGPAGWNVVEVLEGEFVKIATYVSIPTDRQLEARKPDIVAYLKDKWMILIMEMVWAWEPLVAEKEESKRAKY